jgi:hypothetical protein
MSKFVESLKRLFVAGSINEAKLQELIDNAKINQAEFDYIKG